MTGTNFPSISICFPVYNEEATVREVLYEAHTLLSKSGLDYEILVCDDGSTDNSKKIIEDVTRDLSNLRVFYHKENQGIRQTFEELYSKSRKEFVFLNSADKQWQTSIVLELVPLTKEWDVIIASRKKKPYNMFRQLVSWGFNVVPSVLFGVRTVDAGAIKLMRREIIERFALVSRSPFSEAERLIRATRAGYWITEYPVDVSPRTTGQLRGVDIASILSAVSDIFRVWYSINFRKNKRR